MSVNSKKQKLIIFYGPSQSGKSFFARMLKEIFGGEVRFSFLDEPIDFSVIKKYYTRSERSGALEDEGSEFVSEIDESEFDIVTKFYGERSGIKFSDVDEMYAHGKVPIFLTPDKAAVQKMIEKYPHAICLKILRKKKQKLRHFFSRELKRNLDISAVDNYYQSELRFQKYKEIRRDIKKGTDLPGKTYRTYKKSDSRARAVFTDLANDVLDYLAVD